MRHFTRYYYTLAEVLDILNEDDPTFDIYSDKIQKNGSDVGLGTILEQFTDDISNSSTWSTETTYTRTMFNDYLWPEYQGAYILYIDVEHDPWEDPTDPDADEVKEYFSEKAKLIVRWLKESGDIYPLLIEKLSDIKANLMDQLGSTNLTLYNDTPQEASETFFTGEAYVTNATKVTTSADVTTPIARLKEVQDNLRSYYSDWADGFARFVIYSAREN